MGVTWLFGLEKFPDFLKTLNIAEHIRVSCEASINNSNDTLGEF